ncbi:retron St85 family RNA-directed DNA polymerase [Pasteurella multocida]|uniref:retron St85 family RNA-directed DNA polymerase n=1 Tax=Pasteurella multocida TaxID=747 RepID=UPI000D3C2E45|nr:retron St85 family RNA-directed DNA polymerase [Pasteurella multocida]AWB52292.1 RNA-directed DNA polymerase [Pasteurella multocida]HDR1159052.1 retron St85 family RNA-directed DNA polymerase [Pasteurella multocida]
MNILSSISDKLLMNNSDLLEFSRTCPHRYKIYTIPKRNSKKKRVIAQPSKELKFIQRILIQNLENKLPIHNMAFAYRKGISIKNNAQKHLYNDYLLKMDFKDFFESITPKIFFRELEKHKIILSSEDIKFLTGVIFRKEKNELLLSIGSPISPLISNFVMFSFDKIVYELCLKKEITYTRYADDITFSTNRKNILFNIPSMIEDVLLANYEGEIILNKEKTRFTSKAHNRHVTGVTLSNENKLSIGRTKKRELIVALHYFINNKLDIDSIEKLRGELAFAFYIEPDFKNRLIKKYGQNSLDRIRHNN